MEETGPLGSHLSQVSADNISHVQFPNVDDCFIFAHFFLFSSILLSDCEQDSRLIQDFPDIRMALVPWPAHALKGKHPAKSTF